MWKLITGYTIIWGLYLLFKWADYSSLVKIKGVVISSGSFSYGRPTGRKANIPYPIAKFTGPPTIVIEGNEITPAEFDNIDMEVDKLGSITLEKANEIKIYKIDSVRKTHPKIPKTITQYTTTAPLGAFFFSEYQNGDSVDVVYAYDYPREGRVCTLFCYWLPLPSLCILIFFTLLWTGIARISEMPRV